MRPLVINLDRTPRRLAHMEQELGRVGIGFERLGAFDAARLSVAAFDKLAAEYETRAHPHPLTRGQLGALLSHIDAWKRIADGLDDWGVVMEDDLHVIPELRMLLDSSAWIPSGANVVRLETTGQGIWLGKPVRARASNIEVDLAELKGPAWGTAAYAIEKRTARWLSLLPSNIVSPPDYLLFCKGTPIADALSIWQVTPAPCVQDKFHPVKASRLGFDSDIQEKERSAGALRGKTTASIKSVARRVTGKSLVPFGKASRVTGETSRSS